MRTRLLVEWELLQVVLSIESTGKPSKSNDPGALGRFMNTHEWRWAVIHGEIARHNDACDFRVHYLRIGYPAILVIICVTRCGVRGKEAVVAPRNVAAGGSASSSGIRQGQKAASGMCGCYWQFQRVRDEAKRIQVAVGKEITANDIHRLDFDNWPGAVRCKKRLENTKPGPCFTRAHME
jgi:hypothetical protein